MPTQSTLNRFISLVERGEHVQAIEDFYHPSASMQENHLPPRVGKAVLIQHERQVLAGTRTVTSTCVGPVFVSGDLVVIRWLFRFESMAGKVGQLDELAYQRWDGELILEERFFYDPAQMKAAQMTTAA